VEDIRPGLHSKAAESILRIGPFPFRGDVGVQVTLGKRCGQSSSEWLQWEPPSSGLKRGKPAVVGAVAKIEWDRHFGGGEKKTAPDGEVEAQEGGPTKRRRGIGMTQSRRGRTGQAAGTQGWGCPIP